MKTALTHPIDRAPKRRAFFRWAIVFVLLLGATAFSAAPATPAPDIAGSWRILGKDFERRYDITAGRNLTIAGGAIKEKRARLTPQKDGTYLVQLENDAVLRMVFTPANDQLVVECFTKKNLQLGLPAMWKVVGVRMKP